MVRHPARAAALVAEVFGAAGIPFAMPVKRPFADTAIGRALVGLLRCVPGPGGKAPGTPTDLLAWLRAPGMLERRGLADALELEARRGGMRDAGQARERFEQRWFELSEIDGLAAAQARGPAALAERAGRELLRLFAAPRRGRAPLLDAREMDEARALAGGRAALAELRELARFAREAAPASAAELAGVLVGDRGEQRRAARSGTGRRCSTPCSCAQGACGRSSSRDCRRASSRCGRARSRCSASASARVWPRPRGSSSATPRTCWRPSATSSTRSSRGPRSCSR